MTNYLILELDLAFFEVHVDEWFFRTEENQTSYLSYFEEKPLRQTSHKNHIKKVMFLAAVARSKFEDNGECIFDGQIGLWPFTKSVIAQRTSANCPANTTKIKAINVNYNVYFNYGQSKVMSTITDKFRQANNQTIHLIFQHENDPSHLSDSKPNWIEFINRP